MSASTLVIWSLLRQKVEYSSPFSSLETASYPDAGVTAPD